MASYLTFAARYSIENLCHSMTYVITHNLAYEKAGNEDTYYREQEIEPIEGMRIEIACQQMLYEMNEIL